MSKIPAVPRNLDVGHQLFLQAVKKTLDVLSPPAIPPSPPTNVHVNPGPGTNTIIFTGGNGADSHLLLISPQATWDPTKAGNHVVDLGVSTMYTHAPGTVGAGYNYWVVAKRGGVASTPPTGPFKGTTLALGTPAAALPYVKPAAEIVQSLTSGKPTILTSQTGKGRNIL